ncbi:MAG: cell division protein ZipA [Oceanospirillaceae bacterium]|nr:cell division protein ZipA [Oceanospirillaceae bacterium]
MEIDFREWLIVGAMIVILLIIIDGWRRMRAQSNSLKIDIDEKLSDLGVDSYNPELPLGTARVFIPKDKDAKSASTQEQGDAAVTTVGTGSAAKKQQKQHHQQTPEKNISARLTGQTMAAEPVSQPTVKPQPLAAELAATATVITVTEQNIFKGPAVEPLSTTQAPTALQTESPSPDSYVAAQPDVLAVVDPTTVDSQLGFSALSEPVQQPVIAAEQQTVAELNAFDIPDILKTNHIKQAQLNSEPALVDQVDTTNSIAAPPNTEVPDIELDNLNFGDREHSLPASNQQAAIDSPEDVVNNLLQTLARTDNSVSQAFPQADQVADADLTDHSATEEELCRNRDVAPSQRDSGPDMFEQLLAEREQEGFDEAEQSLAAADAAAKKALTADEEIESLKARLKELSPDYIEAVSSTESVVSELTEAAAITADVDENIQQISQPVSPAETPLEEVPVYASQAIDEPSAFNADVALQENELVIGLSEVELQISQDLTDLNDDPQQFNQPELLDQRFNSGDLQAPLTTVIDDDVSLEDLEIPISLLASEASVENLDDLMAVPEVSAEVEDFQLTQQDEAPPAEHPLTERTEVFDENADPLMAGIESSSASQELVEHFERDLQLDQQSVANDLDMPISEILKKNKVADSVNQPELDDQQAETSEDPLMQQTNWPVDVPETDTADVEVKLPQHLDSAADNSANLGFSAVEQGYDADPLMSGFDDSDQQQDTSADVFVINTPETMTTKIQQESLFSLEQELEAGRNARKPMARVSDPNSVLIVTVVAKDQYLNGAALRRIVEACGMGFGEMQIFHRYEDGLESGAVQFSMANAINPGTFDLDTMDQESTPGVSFFMSMDEPLDPKNAFECMIATAETVATHLNGDLLDDDRTVIRPQTKEHYRERVRMHEMNKLRRRAR